MIKPKTILTVLTACMIMLALTVMADDNYQVRSVADALSQEEGSWITVQGNIIEKIKDDYFLLADKSAEIQLKIRGDEWGQYSYDAERNAQVYGQLIIEDGVVRLQAKKVMYVD
jgi:uncharacterized protein (TIGR00156 family)